MDLQNSGIIRLHRPSDASAQASSRTLIVSGVARSGTSMIARILCGAGVFMGSQLDDVVFEDNEFASLFENLALAKIGRLVQRRNSEHETWGFKRPHLHLYGKSLVDVFRNPYMIITMRDPVAIAERNVLSEQNNPASSLSTAVDDLQAMVRFARLLSCPVLLISYEKAVQKPEVFVKDLLDFCGLDLPPAARAPLLNLVEPNRLAYVETANRTFDGYIDNVVGTALFGWAWQRGSRTPQILTLFKDDEPVADFGADLYRLDLAKAGVGSGRHGFSIDLSRFGFTSKSIVSVRVSGRYFTLNNSGLRLGDLINLHRQRQR